MLSQAECGLHIRVLCPAIAATYLTRDAKPPDITTLAARTKGPGNSNGPFRHENEPGMSGAVKIAFGSLSAPKGSALLLFVGADMEPRR